MHIRAITFLIFWLSFLILYLQLNAVVPRLDVKCEFFQIHYYYQYSWIWTFRCILFWMSQSLRFKVSTAEYLTYVKGHQLHFTLKMVTHAPLLEKKKMHLFKQWYKPLSSLLACCSMPNVVPPRGMGDKVIWITAQQPSLWGCH